MLKDLTQKMDKWLFEDPLYSFSEPFQTDSGKLVFRSEWFVFMDKAVAAWWLSN